MIPADFGDRPAVLRCGRCGRIADWNDARVQVVCSCRPRLELPPPLVREASDADRERAIEIFQREFPGRQLVAEDRRSKRLNPSTSQSTYAAFSSKKKTTPTWPTCCRSS